VRVGRCHPADDLRHDETDDGDWAD
jgi:hypothetical protein